MDRGVACAGFAEGFGDGFAGDLPVCERGFLDFGIEFRVGFGGGLFGDGHVDVVCLAVRGVVTGEGAADTVA